MAFKAKVPEGDVKLSLRINIINDQNGIPNLTALANDITGTATFSLPKSLLKSIYSFKYKSDIAYLENTLRMESADKSYQNGNNINDNITEELVNDKITRLLNDGWISATDNNYIGFYTYINGKFLSNGKLMFDIFDKPEQSEQTSNNTPN